MDYVKSWELMKQQAEEQKNKEVLLYVLNNPYGFKLNISHPKIAEKWEDFKRAKGIGKHTCFMDEYRKEFEEQMLGSKYFKRLEAAEAKKYGASYDFIKLHGCWPTEQEAV